MDSALKRYKEDQKELEKKMVYDRGQFNLEYEWTAFRYRLCFKGILEINEEGIVPKLTIVPLKKEILNSISKKFSGHSEEEYRRLGFNKVKIPKEVDWYQLLLGVRERLFFKAYQDIVKKYGLAFYAVVTQGEGGSIIAGVDIKEVKIQDENVGPVKG